MTSGNTFLQQVTAARRAAWQVFMFGVGLQMLTYFGYLGMQQGWLDGLINAGVYGDIARPELAKITFLFVAAIKLMNLGILSGALFLTLWVRGLRRIQ